MSHGSSPAAWTAVLVALVGFTVGGLGLIPEPHWTIFIIGAVLVLLSVFIGPVLAAAGLGVQRDTEHDS